MPITASNILLKYSVKAGTAGNTTSGTPAGSLGRYISITQIPDGTLNNIFDDITGPENSSNTVDYRCLFVHNSHPSLTLENAVVYMSNVAGGADADISVDTTGQMSLGAAAVQAKEIANETVAPAGQVFSAPTTRNTGLSLGNLGPGMVIGVWIRRTAMGGAAINNDGIALTVEGDTAA